MKKFLKITAIVIGSLLVIVVVAALAIGVKPLSLNMHDHVLQTDGVALNEYDAVSYFNGTPVKGHESTSFEYQDARWFFSSVENMEAFKSSPERYAPQYGGYCTFAIGAGFTAPADPTNYMIHDDKLYIFSNDNVKKEFEKDPHASIAACDKKWK